jgi:pectate lyase
MGMEIGRNYRLGLEAIGTRLTILADGRRIADVTDSSLVHGSAGPIMYKMRADYDNVVISPSPLLALLKDDFSTRPEDWWTTLGEGDWEIITDPSNNNNLFEQSSVAGGARAVTGIKTKDQTIQVEARALEFGAGPGRWFGVMARYVDDNNYYYVTVRNDNTVSLRKLVNGNIVVLRTAPFNLTRFQWYELRLEAIGSSLRVYIDDELKLEATDTSFPEGRYGLAMYKAFVNYDRFLASQQ